MKELSRKHNFPYLDGLRGIAALFVVLSHTVLSFYPSMLTDNPDTTHIPYNIEHIIAETPLSICISGSFSVAIFFVLSGFVLTYRFISVYNREEIIKSLLKRYIRLVIPVSCSVMISFIIMHSVLLHHLQASELTRSEWLKSLWPINTNIETAAYSAFFYSMVAGDKTFNPVLWTMQFEFFGSLLILLIILLFGQSKQRWLVYLLLIILLINTYYTAFIIGLSIADYTVHSKQTYRSNNIPITILIFSIYIGSYPEYHENIQGTVYSLFSYLPSHINQIVGASLLVYSAVKCNSIQKFLCQSIILNLGKISFSLYLIHLLIIGSFSSWLFLFVSQYFSYHLAFIITAVPSACLITVLSWLIYRYIDTPAIRISKTFGELVWNMLHRIPTMKRSHPQ